MNSAAVVASNSTSMPSPTPRHVAIIMDGNKRWAEQQHLPVIEGHRRGGEAMQKVINEAVTLAIPYLTVFGFSSENWNRPQQEVSALMNLLDGYLKDKVDELCEKSIALKVIGERTLYCLTTFAITLADCEKKSAGGDKSHPHHCFELWRAPRYHRRDAKNSPRPHEQSMHD